MSDACASLKLEPIQKLIEQYGLDMRADRGESLMHFAHTGEQMDYLTSLGISIDHQPSNPFRLSPETIDGVNPYYNKLGNTPLMSCVAEMMVEKAILLLEKGADISKVSEWGYTYNIPAQMHNAFTLAAAKGYTHTDKDAPAKPPMSLVIYKMLAREDKNSFINYQDANGFSALHYAAMHRDTEFMQKLLDSGISPDLKDKEGRSAFDILHEPYTTVADALFTSCFVFSLPLEPEWQAKTEAAKATILKHHSVAGNEGYTYELNKPKAAASHHDAVGASEKTWVEKVARPSTPPSRQGRGGLDS